MAGSDRVRAFIRHSARHSESDQRAVIDPTKPGGIFVADRERGASDFVRALRKGDIVLVTTLGRLAGTRRGIESAMAAIHAKGCVIVEATTSRRSDEPEQRSAMIFDAIDELAGDRKVHTAAKARKYGKLGGRPPVERLPPKEAEREWFDRRNKSTMDAKEKCPGWSVRELYRKFGPRGLNVGRPRKSR